MQSFLIHLLNPVLVLFQDHLSLHLHGRCQLTGLFTEGGIQQIEIIDLLVMRQGGIHLIHLSLNEGADLIITYEVAVVRKTDPVLLCIVRQTFKVGYNESREVLPAVTHKADLFDI